MLGWVGNFGCGFCGVSARFCARAIAILGKAGRAPLGEVEFEIGKAQGSKFLRELINMAAHQIKRFRAFRSDCEGQPGINL